MTIKLKKAIASYFEGLTPSNIWFGRSKKTESGDWINESISVEDINTSDADWIVNMFVRTSECDVNEFNETVEELSELKCRLDADTAHECKDDVVRYMVRRRLPAVSNS
mgnify:FL=1